MKKGIVVLAVLLMAVSMLYSKASGEESVQMYIDVYNNELIVSVETIDAQDFFVSLCDESGACTSFEVRNWVCNSEICGHQFPEIGFQLLLFQVVWS